MVRLTVDEAKDYIGKTCLVLSDICFIEDTIVAVDKVFMSVTVTKAPLFKKKRTAASPPPLRPKPIKAPRILL